MLFFYAFSFFVSILGFILFVKNDRVALIEWAIATLVAFGTSGIFHASAFYGMTDDKEIWSGKIVLAKQFSAWKEYYETAVYREERYKSGTDSNGNAVYSTKRVFDHWESHRRWHDEYFVLYSDIDTSYRVDKNKYLSVVREFGGQIRSVPGDRTTFNHASRMIDGDKNDYETEPINGCIHPIAEERSFTNRIKAAPSVFSYGKLDAAESEGLFEYPYIYSNFETGRVMGSAKNVISTRKWDEMNAVLGPTKYVNLIIIGFLNNDISAAIRQESKFVGGKKNDVVICYGGTKADKADWVHVFSWTEREDFKGNLESIILENTIGDSILPLISNEVVKTYELKDWDKFDYISIEPRPVHYMWFFIIIALTQVGIWIFNLVNTFGKEEEGVLLAKKRRGF